VPEWISTGSTVLDLAISNRPNGGLPVSKIVEITGLEQSGKSLLAAHVVANTQKKGGIAVYIDTESSLDSRFLRAIGVDVEKMVYVPLETIEEVFDAIEDVILKIRERDPDKLVTIVVDSVAAATTKIEAAADFEKDGYATQKAIIMSKALRKITNLIGRKKILLVFTNQLRQKLNAMPFGDQYTTSGGKSLQFHASVRLRLRNVGKLKEKINGVEEIVGNNVEAQVVKNRLAPPQRKIKYQIYFNSGIDDYSGWLDLMKSYKILSGGGAGWYTYKFGEEEIKFQGVGELKELLKTREDIRKKMYEQICEHYIMLYRHEVEEFDRNVDEVVIEEGGIDEND
jgi:recombination protein RecA